MINAADAPQAVGLDLADLLGPHALPGRTTWSVRDVWRGHDWPGERATLNATIEPHDCLLLVLS